MVVIIRAAGTLARMCKALGDPIRLRLLSMIASHEGGEACVCLIEGERRGTWIYYRALPHALGALAAVLQVEQPTASRM